jgi:hypothetical protein
LTPSLWGVVIVVALIVAGIGIWLLLRDTPPSTPPGRHQRPSKRLPQEPIRKDEEETPDQTDHELDNGTGGQS